MIIAKSLPLQIMGATEKTNFGRELPMTTIRELMTARADEEVMEMAGEVDVVHGEGALIIRLVGLIARRTVAELMMHGKERS